MTWYFCFLAYVFNFGGENYSLNLTFEGVPSTEGGSYYVAVFRKTDPFPSGDQAWKRRIQQVNQMQMLFKLPKGEYAVAVFHDANGNGKMDTNLFGVPTERYGFSNNARGVFSAPSFADASFDLHKDRSIHIRLK